MTRYDAVVIGSGQAGNPLSQKLADLGWTVASSCLPAPLTRS
jgi:pyruvate/2-oxoglutarate dehydrogenase complex dihydrolipoamide dehydrogenase (E3) component